MLSKTMARDPSGIRTTTLRSRQARSSMSSLRASITNPDPIILDTFADANSTSIASHTPNVSPSTGWSQTVSSSFYIQNNSLQPNRYQDRDKAFIDVATNNFTLSATLTPFSSGTDVGLPGLIFRYIDNNNFWYLTMKCDDSSLSVKSVVSGVTVEQIYIKQAGEFRSGISSNIRIDCLNNIITLWVNGAEIVSISSILNLTGKKVGVYVGVVNTPLSKPSWESFTVKPYSGNNINWPIYSEKTISAPVIPLGTSGSWEDGDINDPSVQYDSVNSRWVMAYTGVQSGSSVQNLGIAYASSIGGPWTKEAANPVLLSVNGDINGINGGLLFFKNLWYYYYGASNASVINVATSPDLITWTKRGVVLSGGPVNTWDSGGVADAFARLRQDGKTIELWYAGRNNSKYAIGYATSTDGLLFTSYPDNPIIVDQQFCGASIGEPSIFVPTGKEGQQILITYDGAAFNSSQSRFIVQALSLDNMKTWHYCIALKSPGGSGWESVQVFDSDVLLGSDNALYIFHSGANVAGHALGLNIQIGYAKTDYTFQGFVR